MPTGLVHWAQLVCKSNWHRNRCAISVVCQYDLCCEFVTAVKYEMETKTVNFVFMYNMTYGNSVMFGDDRHIIVSGTWACMMDLGWVHASENMNVCAGDIDHCSARTANADIKHDASSFALCYHIVDL